MGFWNYIGLASKKDVENINIQLQELNKLINVCIESNNKATMKSNELEKNIANAFNNIESKIDIISTELKEKIQIVNDNNMYLNEKNIEIISEKNNELQNKIVDLNNSLSPIYSEIIDNKKSNNEKFMESNKCLKQLVKDFKENKKNVEAVNRDVSIVQQMIRVAWVNDIIDTLESKFTNKRANDNQK